MGISSYSTSPGSNSAISGTNIAEGCNPSGINDAIRQMMADIASGVVLQATPTTTGSAGTYAVTLAPAATTWTNLVFFCIANFTSVGSDTINPNGVGAKALYKKTSGGAAAAIAAGDVQTGDLLCIGYDGTHAQILSSLAVTTTGATVSAGTTGRVLAYTGSSTVGGTANFTISTGALTLGASGTLGSVTMGNATSGTVNLQPVTGALGAVTVKIPAATDTLIGKATTDTLTNKTYDTAGSGNSFSINGQAVASVSGNTSKVGTVSGSFTSGHYVKADASGNLVDGGATSPLLTPLGVGSITLATGPGSTAYSAGDTEAAANLSPKYLTGSGSAATPTGDTLSGTWKALTSIPAGGGQAGVGLWQRTV